MTSSDFATASLSALMIFFAEGSTPFKGSASTSFLGGVFSQSFSSSG
jgi:hypothetical protein